MDPLRQRPAHVVNEYDEIEYRKCDHEGCDHPGLPLPLHQLHQKITTPYHAFMSKMGTAGVGTHICKAHVAKEVNAASYADLKRSGVLGAVLQKRDELYVTAEMGGRTVYDDRDASQVPDSPPKDWMT
jgi:hypothetical protein